MNTSKPDPRTPNAGVSDKPGSPERNGADRSVDAPTPDKTPAKALAKHDPLAFCDWLIDQPGVCSIHIDEPFYPAAARALHNSYAKHWPDGSQIQILLPHGDARRALTQALLGEPHSQTGCFGLNIDVMRSWALRYLPTQNLRYCSDDEALLALALRIKKHGGVRFNQNQWQFSPALIHLFNRLEQHRIDKEQLQQAVEQKRQSWQLDKSNYLAIEAEIAQIIWWGWREELGDKQYLTSVQAYNQALDKFVQLEGDLEYWIMVPDEPIPAEQSFLRKCLAHPRCQLVVCNRTRSPSHQRFAAHHLREPEPQTTRHRWLHHCLIDKSTTRESPPVIDHPGYQLLRCTNEARQIEAIVAMVSEAKAARQRVGIVVHNRRFARALRAAMDSNGLRLYDRTGWALSTTFSGSLLKIWLNVIDRGYLSNDVFNFLRTAMPVFASTTKEFFHTFDLLRARLEQHFLANFKPEDDLTEIINDDQAVRWIKKIHQAGAPLQAKKNSECTLATWFSLLEQSLQSNGLWDLFADDENGSGAGGLVIERIRRLQQPNLLAEDLLDWSDFLSFLDHQLEHNRYAPSMAQSDIDADLVQMANILPEYDWLIFAAMEQDNFPGRFQSDLLFNDEIYLQLGLQAPQRERERRMLDRFIEALLSQAKVVFAYSAGADDALPCPWLSQIIDLCEQESIDISGQSILDKLENASATQLGQARVLKPHPNIAHPGIDTPVLSVAQYQTLLDCPYRFFLQSKLNIRPTQRISQLMRADIYGQLAHRCLKELNEYIIKSAACPLSSSEVAALIEVAEKIVEEIYSGWMQGSLINLAHMIRAKNTMSEYCRWLYQQGVQQVLEPEQSFELTFNEEGRQESLVLKGRIDFMLRFQTHKSIVDFKSSSSRYSIKAIKSDRDVQLPAYALGFADISGAFYLSPVSSSNLQKPLILKKIGVGKEDIEALAQTNKERLSRLAIDMSSPHRLPARPQDKKCQVCRFESVCQPREWLSASIVTKTSANES